MFGLGISEIIVIVIAALIFIGPKQLPDFIRSAGKLFVHVRRAANEVKSTVDGVIREAEDDIRKETKSIGAAVDAQGISKNLSEIPGSLEALKSLGSLDTSAFSIKGTRGNFATGGLALPLSTEVSASPLPSSALTPEIAKK